jgi:hypothetical protein
MFRRVLPPCIAVADCRDFCSHCSDRWVYLDTSQPIVLQGGQLIEKEWVAGFLLRNQLFANNPAVDFQDRTLSQNSCCRLVIPTVRANHGEAEVIVTPRSPDRKAFSRISAVEAALASSAAPSYFDEAFVDDAIAVQNSGIMNCLPIPADNGPRLCTA